MSVVIANTTQAYEAGPLSAHVWAPGPPAPCLASRTLSMSLCGVPAQEPTVRAHLARSWEGVQRSGPGQAPSLPWPARSWRGLCPLQFQLGQKLPYECGFLPELGRRGRGGDPLSPAGASRFPNGRSKATERETFPVPRWVTLEVGRGLPVGRAGHAGSQQVWEGPRTGMRPQLSFSRWQLV